MSSATRTTPTMRHSRPRLCGDAASLCLAVRRRAGLGGGGCARSARGSAAIEMAILFPLYMLVVFGVLYFGYLTLSRQRQANAAAYAAWSPRAQQPTDLAQQFFPGMGPVTAAGAGTAASAGDVTMGFNRYQNRAGDEYYSPQGPILPNSATDFGGADRRDLLFSAHRIASMVTAEATGKAVKRMRPSATGEPQVIWNRRRSDMGSELERLKVVDVGTFDSPRGLTLTPPMTGTALILNGPAGTNQPWLDRHSADTFLWYTPSYMGIFTSNENPIGPHEFNRFITLDYGPAGASYPENRLVFDVTRRSSSAPARLGAIDGALPADVLQGANWLLSQTGGLRQGLADAMPVTTQATGPDAGDWTLQDIWTRH